MISLISVCLVIFYVYSTFYIFMLNHRSNANYIFWILNINFSISSLANFMLINAVDHRTAYFWVKVYRYAVLPIPVLLLVGILLLAFPKLNYKVKLLYQISASVILLFWIMESTELSRQFFQLYRYNNIYRWKITLDSIESIIYNFVFILLYVPSIVFSLWWLKNYIIRTMNKWSKIITMVFIFFVVLALAGIFFYLIIVKDGLYNGIFYFVLVGLPISTTYFAVFQERKLPLVTLNVHSEKIVDSLREGVLFLDENYQLLYYNAFAKEMLGFEDGKQYDFRKFGIECYDVICASLINKPLFNKEGALTSATGDKIRVSFAFSKLVEKKDGQNGYLFLFMDITKFRDMENKLTEANRKLHEQIIWRTNVINERNNALLKEIKKKEENRHRIEYFLENDYLTELYNKNGFLNKVGYTGKSSNSVLISIEILNYKIIFESFSRLIAEQVIVELSDFLKLNWDHTDVVMARLENSRFLINCLESQYEEIAGAILKKFKRPILIDGFKIEVECGIGISLGKEANQDIHEMIIESDIATGEAKKYGCHQFYVYDEETSKKNSADFLMLNDYLYVALNENRLFMQYKLRFNIEGKPIGLIAMAAWQVNKDKRIEEKEIIEIADKHNFSYEFEIWRMRQLVKDLGYLLSIGKGVSLPIMIRISKAVYYTEDYLNQLIRILDENEIDKSLFEFALGEDIFREATEFNKTCLANIRKHNIKVGLNHFGGLYSSLKYLRDLDIDFIVPAQEFIEGIGNNTRDEAILKKLLDMAKSMNFNIIIQYVHDKKKLDFLADDCFDFAGKYFFEASNIEKVIEYLQHYELGDVKCNYY